MILGYLNPDVLVGGDLPVNFDKAAAAIDDLGVKLGQDRTEMAYGIHLIANATMYRALSGVTSEKGRDPAQFDLLTIGGNGGVHAAGLADTLNIQRIVVPPAAGLFSAMGLSFADVEHHLVRGFYHLVRDIDVGVINATAMELVTEAEALLIEEGFAAPAQRDMQLVADVKYFGQSWAMPFRRLRLPGPRRTASHSQRTADPQDREGLSRDDRTSHRHPVSTRVRPARRFPPPPAIGRRQRCRRRLDQPIRVPGRRKT